MKLSICLLEPEGYRFSHFLYDICKYFCYTIDASGYDCCMVKNRLYPDRINIIFGAHNLKSYALAEQIKQSGKYIIMQTERLREGGIANWPDDPTFKSIYIPLMQQAFAVWSGLESNEPYLNKLGITSDWTPRFGYLPALEEVIHKKNKDIDFLYYGSLTPHRQKMIDELKKRGGNVVCIFDEAAIFRNDYIARTRINLAPNQSPEHDGLTIRVLYMLNNRCHVALEQCFDQDWVEHCLTSAATEHWADMCMETLQRPDLDQLTEEYFQRYKQLDMVYLYQPLLDNLKLKLSGPLKGERLLTDKSQNPLKEINSDHDLLMPDFKNQVLPGLTSIIIITHNSLDQIKRCLKSIRKHTPEAHEIIFVDNGSTDDTLKWLQGQARENKSYQLIENKSNIGQVKGRNQGINLSKGEFIVLMDNDVVVSEGWLSGMRECLSQAPLCGIIGAMTNNSDGMQKATDESYQTVNYLDKYAAQYKERFRHRRIHCRNLDGFCMFFKRTLAENIGLFDKRFDTGQCEDEDFCIRAALAGYSNYIAGDVFLHCESKKAPGNRIPLEDKWTLTMGNPEGKKLALLKAIEYANLLHSKGEIDQAVEALVNCIKFAPDTKEIYYELARIFIESKKFPEAWEVIGTMPEEAKNSIKGLEWAGYTKEGMGLNDEAMGFADRILSLDSANPSALNLKGILAFKKDQIEEAQNYFKQAIQSDPGFGEPYTNLGILYWKMDKKNKALASLRKGFILSPNVPDNCSIYYSALTTAEEFSQAEDDFAEANRLYPSHKNIAFLYIDILIRQGKLDDAMLKIEDALNSFGLDDALSFLVDEQLHVSPDYTPALTFKAALLCLKMEVDKADEYFESLKREKGNISARFNKFAEHLMNNEKNNEALLILNAVVKNKINDTETMMLLAESTIKSFAAQEIMLNKDYLFKNGIFSVV